MSGDGAGGSEVKIGDQTGQECINACKERKKTDATINGVTIRKDGNNGCWCEKKMSYVTGSSRYKTCYLDPEGQLHKKLHKKLHKLHKKTT